MIRIAISMKVAKLGELCIDGTRVPANANRYRTWTADRVGKVIAALDEQLVGAMAELETADNVEDLIGQDITDDHLPPEIADLKVRREKLDEILGKLNAMDAERKKYGKDPKTNPAQIPKTDPDARTLLNKEGGYAPNYTPMAVTETESGFIVAADVVIGNVEHDQLLPMGAIRIRPSVTIRESLLNRSDLTNCPTIRRPRSLTNRRSFMTRRPTATTVRPANRCRRLAPKRNIAAVGV